MARVYVGTYAKYNNGSIKGQWLDLEALGDHDAFVAACKELHKDEHDPELMFQDYEGFPSSFYGESHIKPGLWDWLALDESDRELLEAFQNAVESDADMERAREAFIGAGYDTEADWAAEYLEESGTLESIPENLRNYFDYAAYARDARLGGDVVFHRDSNSKLWVFHAHS